MTTRIIVFLALLAVLPALWIAVRARGALARRRLVGRWTEPALAGGVPTVLFFTGEHCTVCHFRQKPALERLKAERIADSLKLALFYRPDRPWPPESTR